MKKPLGAPAPADAAFWSLVDARAKLIAEHETITRADGRPRGFALLNWESPMRRRASLLTAQIAETNERFDRARTSYASMMRVRVAAEAATMRDVCTAQVEVAAAKPVGEFASIRSRVRASAAVGDEMASALRVLEKKVQGSSGDR